MCPRRAQPEVKSDQLNDFVRGLKTGEKKSPATLFGFSRTLFWKRGIPQKNAVEVGETRAALARALRGDGARARGPRAAGGGRLQLWHCAGGSAVRMRFEKPAVLLRGGRRSRMALLAATTCAPAAAAGRCCFASVLHRLARLLAAVLLLAPACRWCGARGGTTNASLCSSHPSPALPPRTRRTPLGGQCLKSRAGRACCVRETARILRRATMAADSGTQESGKGQKSDGKSLYQIPEDFQ